MQVCNGSILTMHIYFLHPCKSTELLYYIKYGHFTQIFSCSKMMVKIIQHLC